MTGMKTASGVIAVVQEHRFQLEDEHGRRRLFILTQDASLEWRDLKRLEQGNCPVTVFYRDADNLIAAAAHDVRER